MITVQEALGKIQKCAAEISRTVNKNEVWEFPRAASEGDYFRQGDLYIWWAGTGDSPNLTFLVDLFQVNQVVLLEEKVNRQLAIGNSRGSRHILSSGHVKMFSVKDKNELGGPVFKVLDENTCEHPEHQHVKLISGDWFAITYQRTMAQELRRVKD